MASYKSKSGSKINVAKAAEESSAAEDYVTPGGYELEKILNRGSVAYTHVNKVWPNVYIGDDSFLQGFNPGFDSHRPCALASTNYICKGKGSFPTLDSGLTLETCGKELRTGGGATICPIQKESQTAKDKFTLKGLGITHILNAAEGTWNNVDTGADYYRDMDVVYFGMVAEDIPTFDLSQYFFSAAKFIKETLENPQNKLLVHCVMGRSRSATLFLAYLMIYENMTVVDAIEHVKRQRRIIPNWGFLKQLRELDQQLLEGRGD